jgi:hypothetical protein
VVNIIYGLVDPRTWLIRYVGMSTSGATRPAMHRQPHSLRRVSRKNGWLKSLFASGLDYTVVVLDTAWLKESLPRLERFWIAYGRACGWPLTNHTDGGEGKLGCYPDVETRAKMSAAAKGRKLSAATVARMRGRQFSDETRSRIGAKHRGKVVSAATRAKLAEARRAAWARMSAVERSTAMKDRWAQRRKIARML